MKLNAVIDREIRSRMRTWRSPATITLYLGVLAFIALMFFWLEIRNSYRVSYRMGMELYMILAIVQFGLIAFVTPALTSGSITGEKERQTLDILLVTKLSAPSIVLGKLFSSLSYLLLLIFASVPLFSLVFLFGGVAPSEILITFGVYIFTAIYLGSMGVFYSAITKRTQISTVLTYLTVLVLGVGTYMIGWFYRGIFKYELGITNVQYDSIPLIFHFNPLNPLILTISGGEGKRFLWEIGHMSQSNFVPGVDWATLGITVLVQITVMVLLIFVSANAIKPTQKWRLFRSRKGA